MMEEWADQLIAWLDDRLGGLKEQLSRKKYDCWALSTTEVYYSGLRQKNGHEGSLQTESLLEVPLVTVTT